MTTQKTIAVIGACSANGRTASKMLAGGNRLLLLADEGRDDLLELKNEIMDEVPEAATDIMECMKEAGWEADVVVLALNWQAEREIFTMIKPFITGKTVISFSKDNNCLLPYSKVIAVNENNWSWVKELESSL